MKIFSVFQQKEQMHFEAFVRLLCTKILSIKNVSLDTIVVDTLSSEEIERFSEETVFFRLEILVWLLINNSVFGKRHYSSNEIGEIIVNALFLGYQDVGLSSEIAKQRTGDFLECMSQYSEFIVDKMERTKYNKEAKDIFFHILGNFTERVLRGTVDDLRTETGSKKHFIIFSLANDIYKQDTRAFYFALKKVKFM